MKRLSEEKIILITSMTRLEFLKRKFNSVSQAKFYVEHLGADFNDYIKEDEMYHDALAACETALNHMGRLQVVQRQFLPNYIFGKKDIIAVLGRDGLVANTLKYLDGQLCIGINPDPDRWDGILLPFHVEDTEHVLEDIFSHQERIKEVTMAKATLQNGEILYGVNDLFVGARTHVSARYSIIHGEIKEEHSSSGIIISTGLGSTAWLKSVVTGASKIVSELAALGADQADTGEQIPGPTLEQMNWDADFLYYSVREPFPSRTSGTTIVFGKVTRENPLEILSHMPNAGVIFSDGIEKDFVSFTSGMKARVTIAEKKGRLVV
jgi:NAD kinase